MIRELRTGEGGLASALDADSDGEEGLFYTWTPAELREVLGPEDAGYAAEVFGVTADGTFEHGRSVLQRRADPGGRGALAAGQRNAAGRPRRRGCARAATTRWSPPGTGSRSPRSPSAGCSCASQGS